jgi:hypothetical protein
MASIASELSALRGQWQVTETSVRVVSNATQYPLLTANPLSWSFVVSSPSLAINPAFGLYLTTAPNLGLGNGLLLSQYNPVLEFNYRQYGALVQLAWYYQCTAAPNFNFTVIEILSVSGVY